MPIREMLFAYLFCSRHVFQIDDAPHAQVLLRDDCRRTHNKCRSKDAMHMHAGRRDENQLISACGHIMPDGKCLIIR